MSDLYTLRQVSEMTGLSVSRLLRRIKSKKLRARKIGWFWVIEPHDIERLKEEIERKQMFKN